MTNAFEIPVTLKQLISSNQAFRYRIVPIANRDNITLLITDADEIEVLNNELQILLGFPFTLEKRERKTVDSYLTYNYRTTTRESTKNLSSTHFLEQLLQTANDFNSSDIHLEPTEKYCRVRFRLDGKLKEQYSIPLHEYPQLVNQIKTKAHLDISQKRLSQDGRITVTSANNEFDIRVSTMPTLRGEKIVLRILKKDAQKVALEDLGFNKHELNLFLEGIKKPNGIVLISGPTGSGKTTTLYGTLKILNKEETNIVTIEDPIEYTLDGINQVQLKEDIGLDFPSALRTFLRQDPDVIMVGEIRDEKTAMMAIKAAMTGHLVLSTIHTNSAWATISRLIDMGIAPYLIATTLNMSVAQRLVRKLCNHCKKEVPIDYTQLPSNFTNKKTITKQHEAVGCNECYFTGYNGRKAIYEIVPITNELELAIKENQLQIDTYLAKHNLKTLQENAITLINSGETSIKEAYALLTH